MKKELLIFGADGNLGNGVTEILSKKDFEKIYLFGQNPNSISILNDKTEFIHTVDLSIEENVINIFSKIQPAKDKLFFLFSTIGGYDGGKNLWEIEQKDWEFIFKLNVNISFLIAKHFSLLVKKSAGGSICFTTALTSLQPEGNKSSYGASKAALNYLVQTLAVEGKEISLSANAIAPFILDTKENRQWVTDQTSLIKLNEIGELVSNIFENFRIVSGNIIRLPYNLNI
ncbi:MAG: SDR family NAD(P)-dependent oxidoreductase [Ignavibacteriales bacterium]|nr:SDR family NAD(P)-dependent oxidoreductase [Ignavibacteriales bacterium]